jgi:hypothetical protein
VSIDQLVIDPVAAALRKLVDVEFACGKHHFACVAVDLIAIDVDVREIVVGADFLDLAERVFERFHIPQADVLQRWLVVRGIGRTYGNFCRKLMLRE